ncbi:MAG: CcmD family protein [Saprospiraceae bacterium]|nr:CcmD family protein [Saprospiraceae bacterium]
MSCLAFFFHVLLQAQSPENDFLRSTGKIYSVVAGIVIVFAGLAIYLWRLDRKLTKLEKHINDEHETS